MARLLVDEKGRGNLDAPMVRLPEDALTPEAVAAAAAAAMSDICAAEGQQQMADAFSQTRKFACMAAELRGMPMPWGA